MGSSCTKASAEPPSSEVERSSSMTKTNPSFKKGGTANSGTSSGGRLNSRPNAAPPVVPKEVSPQPDPEAEFAKKKRDALIVKKLLSRGRPPKVVRKFINGNGLFRTAKQVKTARKAAIPTAEWLVKIVNNAHLDPKLKKAAINLLVTGPKFSSNMSFLKVFDKPFRSGITANLERLGAKLKARYDELDLGTVLGETAVGNLTWYHKRAIKAEEKGRDFTMTNVLPDFPKKFRNAPENKEILEMYGERCYLLSTVLLSMAVDRFFQAAVLEVARKVGLAEDAIRAAKPKSFVRARNKMDSKDDHRCKPKPRPAYNIDLMRCLAMAMTPEMLKAFHFALLERFGGAGKVKNLYALPEDERADRFHLVSLMVTVVFDANMNYAELCQLPETKKIWDEYLGTPDKGEPKDRWEKMGAVARRYLESLGNRPVVALGEVQTLLREFAEIRHIMHSPYKCRRAADPSQLYNDYLQGRPKLMIMAPRTNLWSACFHGQRDVAERYIAEGTNVDVINNNITPLYVAANHNHLDVARLLISKGADVNKASTHTGTSPLYIASTKGHFDVARLLISKGADVNKARTDTGSSPLYMASQDGHLDVARLLISKGADVNKASSTEGVSPLFIASTKGHLDVARLLISKGADVDQQNHNKQAPLNISASEGLLDLVRLLVESNANLNSKSKWGTPLRQAIDGKQPEVAEYLRSKGARE